LDTLKVELDNIGEIDMSEFGFNLDGIGEEPQEVQEDDFDEEPPEEPTSKLGDIYQLGNHRLMCGDSTNAEHVAKLMDGAKADMVFTDPPYGVDYQGICNDDRQGLEKLLDSAFANIREVSNAGISVYCFHSDRCADIFNKVYRKYCHFSSMIIWVKKSLVLSQTDYQSQHEPCLYGWLNNGTHNWYGDRKQVSVWNYERESRKDHTTPKPVALCGNAIKNSSRESNNVLDLFGGSGSTLIACEQLNRKCYMMEMSPKYVDVIIKRWEEYTGKKAVKIA
jgi:site-specific DNA-methyltransferase (adenine-specific)